MGFWGFERGGDIENGVLAGEEFEKLAEPQAG